jgi:arylformamidase
VRGFHAAGLNVAFVGYTLAPEARMERIVGDAVDATRWLAARLASFGLAARPLIVVGWSAGAHLAALLTSEPSVAGGMGVSGVYDLRELRDSAMNDTLRLDAQDADRYSPELHVSPGAAPFVVAFGGRELEAYRRQSTDFHLALARGGAPSELHEMPGHHHHSVLEELFEPEGRLVSRLAAMASTAAVPSVGQRTAAAPQ